ncbi:Zn-dependent hydrolase [Paraoerskovia sediminicola]|uniref:Zn-dependent hydrolase n=1 Tax=Paraoerskovia sediminicola TaxID=1138587 RepID=A0ABN6XF58_9CELL|nr:MBL fold metallo-hydrolase [Paraoerskovia sediminicola]BDZ43558.1 Zn-dependent hydrolase [Paraoerskovia sediminicola]
MTTDYTGDVSPGGPPAVRHLDEVDVRKASVGPMDNNAYLITCHRSGEQLLIDAAADPDALLSLVREGSSGAALSTVVTTHRHPDHTGALAAIVAVTGATALAGAADAEAIIAATRVPVDALESGQVLTVGHAALEVVALRGHTPGSVALAYREPAEVSSDGAVAGRVHLFTGDSLFPGGPGKTAGPEEFTSLMDDLEARVFDRFGDDTWVYPGHGRDTTLGTERSSLGKWRARGW